MEADRATLVGLLLIPLNYDSGKADTTLVLGDFDCKLSN